ncbi:MAG: UDP-N-acetylmuramoylalanyl-D-glutamate--2,6-diaminopimelate ligase [Firmicutes bacterium ADurb.Bin456]|nr:MAG: UDP-N-acetylmuramoylalanyl-D-glutamate--2,6-diaminopimelate ligase [Firmicutes bacterium ADurb.Bin456]
MILNADDPLVAQYQRLTGFPAVFYGLAARARLEGDCTQAREGKFCPFCGAPLVFDYCHFSQPGQYHCPGCDFNRPGLLVEALEPEAGEGRVRCRLVFNGQEAELILQVQGLYNLYNAVAAFSAGFHLGLDVPGMLESLGRYRPITGRMEKFNYQGKPVYLNLVKNPVGFNESLAALCAGEGSKDVFVAINDNDADGRDISWLWDVDFEMLGRDHRPYNCFICSGLRGEEMAVRLKYAGVPIKKLIVEPDVTRAIKRTLTGGSGSAYLFSTYTALWTAQRIIKTLASEGVAAR